MNRIRHVVSQLTAPRYRGRHTRAEIERSQREREHFNSLAEIMRAPDETVRLTLVKS